MEKHLIYFAMGTPGRLRPGPPGPEGHRTLRKRAFATTQTKPGTGCYLDGHQLIDTRTGAVEGHEDWEWAGSRRDRLMWAKAGCLYAGRLSDGGLPRFGCSANSRLGSSRT